jgi:CRISPR/Cas system-associated exonuclease Cas4 (RecB family)
MKNLPNIPQLYTAYIHVKEEINRLERYEGNEKWFHGSGSGLCHRKHYFQTTKVEVSNPRSDNTHRVLRLGSLFHEEIEDCLDMFINIKKKKDNRYSIYNTIYKGLVEDFDSIKDIHVEGEVTLPSLNVRGFYDFVVEMTSGEIYLYDVKTMNMGSWYYQFGKDGSLGDVRDPSEHHQLQLATYGMAVKHQFGRLDGMFLIMYSKDKSFMEQKEVNLSKLREAEDYWKYVNLEVKPDKSPPILNQNSPMQRWECRYCDYKDHCISTG